MKCVHKVRYSVWQEELYNFCYRWNCEYQSNEAAPCEWENHDGDNKQYGQMIECVCLKSHWNQYLPGGCNVQ